MLAVPPAILDLLDLAPGGTVGLSVADGKLVVEPTARRRYRLDDLLDETEMAGTAPADEAWIASPPVGRELL